MSDVVKSCIKNLIDICNFESSQLFLVIFCKCIFKTVMQKQCIFEAPGRLLRRSEEKFDLARIS